MAGVIVHEWLERFGGAEQVVEEMAALYPDAPIQCLWDDVPTRFAPGRVRETWLARTPLRQKKSLALPFMPATWRHLGPSEAEWILCSSHLFAHHARFSGAASDAKKYVYAYTPARYIWNPELDMRGNSVAARAASVALRPLDRTRAQEAHSVAGISEFVSQRIRDSWGIDSEVIYPPVDVNAFTVESTDDLADGEQEILDSLPGAFALGASRFIPYKRLDLAIEVGLAAGIQTVLAGDGPLKHDLKQLANRHPGQVIFVDRPSRALLREIYRKATVFVFPPIEDFGIMPVEAMATGTPVLASAIGGAAETVLDGVTGRLLSDWNPAAIKEAVEEVVRYSKSDTRERSFAFDRSVFHARMLDWVGK